MAGTKLIVSFLLVTGALLPQAMAANNSSNNSSNGSNNSNSTPNNSTNSTPNNSTNSTPNNSTNSTPNNSTNNTTTTTTTTTTTVKVIIPTVTIPTTTVSINTDCTVNPVEWSIILNGVDENAPDFDEVVKCSMAKTFDTACDCITVEGPIASRRLADGRRLLTGRKGKGGAPNGKNESDIADDCKNAALQESICKELAANNSSNCTVVANCGLFTTTTEMPWGMPWWGWFLVCCGICSLCLFCLAPLGALGGGGKKKSKAAPTPSTEVVYEVVDVPDVPGTAY